MNKIKLSYSTLANLYTSPHSYLNKLIGITIPDNEYTLKGKEVHKIIQDHATGIKRSDIITLQDLWYFHRAEVFLQKSWNDKYNFIGYIDGVNYANKTILEIKSSSKTPKSQSELSKLIQTKIYCYLSGFRKVYFVACTFDLHRVNTYLVQYTDKDIEEAKNWVNGAIKILEEGNLKADLVDGVCIRPDCPYSDSCFFKK